MHATDGAIPISGARRRALLATLLVSANEVVSDSRLLEELWGTQPPESGTAALRVRVSQLRLALAARGGGAPVLARQAEGYVLRVDRSRIDASRFERLLAEGIEAMRQEEPETAAAKLRGGLALWRGPALAEFPDLPGAAAEAARLTELRLAGREELIEAQLAVGRHVEVIAELEALVAAEPLRERARGQLMLALYRSGRQADALAAYRKAERTLREELGLEPSRSLRELERGILTQEPTLERPGPLWATGPPVAGPRGTPLRVDLPMPPALLAATDGPLVGRDHELARLHGLWGQGNGARLAVIGGEAGIGKTRLAAELASVAGDEDALVLYGHCDEGVAIPYQPFAEALRPYAATVGASFVNAALGALAPELGRLLPELGVIAEPQRVDAEAQRFGLFEGVVAAFALAARDRRVLLVLDDLHWASEPTVLALGHLLRSEQAAGTFVVGTYRHTEVEVDHPLATLVAERDREGGSATIDLGGLDAGAVATLVTPVFVGRGAGREHEVAAAVHDGTGGNPFYIREVVAHLVESGALPAGPLALPAGLRRVIVHRISRLSRDARRALAVAAVAGTTFSLPVLERVLGAEYSALDSLDEIATAGLVSEVGGGEYAFVHALVQRTVYEDLSAARRLRLHRRTGEAIEALAHADRQVQALAHHFAQAAADGQGTKAAAYALAAGATSMTALGYAEAAAHYERGLGALDFSEAGDSEVRCELHLGLGEARWSGGDMDRARAAFLTASELAEQIGDAPRLSRAALGYCGPPRFEPTTEQNQPVAALLERALAATPDEDGPERARLTGRLAAALTFPGPADRRNELARTALAMARRAGDKAALADAIASTYFATRGPDNLDARVAAVAELGRLAEELGDGLLAALAHYWRSLDLLALGQVAGVRRELGALERLAQALGQRYPRWLLAASRARDAQLQGQLELAETLAHGAFEAGEMIGEAAAQVFGAQLVWVRREQGRIDELIEGVEAVVQRFPELVAWRCGLALFYVETGREDEARLQLDDLAADGFAGLQRDVLWLLGVTVLGEVAAHFEDRDRCATLYELLLPHAAQCIVAESAVCHGSAARGLGVLATTLSRYDEAVAHFDAALEMNAAIRSPLWMARTQHDYARMLRRRDGIGDRRRAIELGAEAAETADRLGLRALQDQLQTLAL